MTSTFTKALPIVKMHGAGNDFVVLDALASPLPADFDYSAAALHLCQRHFHLGGDGLLLLDGSENAEIRMRMWNPDGTEDMCGNGLRCIAWLAHERGHVKKDSFNAQTLAGLRHCEILGPGLIRIEMGLPTFELGEIPFAPGPALSSSVDYTLPLYGLALPHVTSLSTGSTHTVIFVDELPDDAFFLKWSPIIENHSWFPERTTVLWTRLENEALAQVRIWERGVGETLACGTGACAVGVAASVSGRAQGAIDVQSKGGVLGIEVTRDGEIRMTGPARVVFEGSATL